MILKSKINYSSYTLNASYIYRVKTHHIPEEPYRVRLLTAVTVTDSYVITLPYV